MAGNVWMVPGPGMHVFLGGPAGVSPGQQYLPDDLAREIVTKHDLRKGWTISKQAIQDHLESVGVSIGLTTDVAMILRNVYGVQPMFYEDNEKLIGELGGVLTEGYPGPFRVDAPEILNEDERFRLAIEDAFCEAKDVEEEEMIAALSTMSLEDVTAIAHLDAHLSEDQMEMLEAAYEHGGDILGEACIDLIARPHMFAFTEEVVLEHLEAICESRCLMEDARTILALKAKGGAKKPTPGTPGHAEYLKKKFPRAHAIMQPNKKQKRRAAASAELAKREKAGTAPKGDEFHKSISKRLPNEMGHTFSKASKTKDPKLKADIAKTGSKLQRKHGEMITRSKVDREAAQDAGTHKPLPGGPKKPGLLKRGAQALSGLKQKVSKKVSDWGKSGMDKQKQARTDKSPTAASVAAPGAEKKPGFFGKVAKAAGGILTRVGQTAKASVRARAPRVAHVAFGKETSGEADARKVRQGVFDTKAKVKQARDSAKAAMPGAKAEATDEPKKKWLRLRDPKAKERLQPEPKPKKWVRLRDPKAGAGA